MSAVSRDLGIAPQALCFRTLSLGLDPLTTGRTTRPRRLPIWWIRLQRLIEQILQAASGYLTVMPLRPFFIYDNSNDTVTEPRAEVPPKATSFAVGKCS